MKKIIFLDGIDGAGKTETVSQLNKKIYLETNLKCQIVNKNFSDEFNMLFKIDERKGFKSNKLARLSYRFSRLSIALNTILNEKSTIGIFDRGLLHFIVRCKLAMVEEVIINHFVEDFTNSITPSEYGTIFLNPPISIAFQRLEKRENPSKIDRDKEYLKSYYKIALDVFKNNKYLGKTIQIDTNKNNLQETIEIIYEFMKK